MMELGERKTVYENVFETNTVQRTISRGKLGGIHLAHDETQLRIVMLGEHTIVELDPVEVEFFKYPAAANAPKLLEGLATELLSHGPTLLEDLREIPGG